MAGSEDRLKQKPVVIFTARDELEAGLVKELLRQSGIECVVRGPVAPGLYPVSIGELGRRDILVLEADEAAARSIIDDWRSGAEEPSGGGPESEESESKT